MEYMQALQTVGGFVFAIVFWLMCYKLEKTVTSLKN